MLKLETKQTTGATSVYTAVAPERNEHCGGEARPEGPKLEARRAKTGWGFRGRAVNPSPPAKWSGGAL